MIVDPAFVLFAKLIVATLLGALIGTERALIARQTAGMRTFALVTLGSCAFVIAGSYIDAHAIGLSNFDPMRIAAGIVMGVGFIGGGVMFQGKDGMHGVTTAAGLWVAAAIGILVGFGLYSVAFFTAALTMGIFFGLWYVEHRIIDWYHE